MKKKQQFKKATSKLGININVAIPMIEEVTEKGMIPACIIGLFANTETNKVDMLFATLSDEHDEMIYKCCKAFVETFASKYPNI